jgi:hypothetical protein
MVAAMFTTIRITSAMRCYLNSSRLLAVGTDIRVFLALTVRRSEAFRRHPQPNQPSSQNTNRKDSV